MQNLSFDRLLGVAGLILAIASLAAAYIFYKKSLKVKQPTYVIRTNNLIQNSISQINGLEITYKGRKVENLSVSKIIFWNKGTETIDNQDIIKVDSLRFECSENKHILDASIITSNKLSNQLRIEVVNSAKIAHIEFDYLDKGNGGVFQIIHTGTSSSDVFFKGELKGAIIQNDKARLNNVWFAASSALFLIIGPSFIMNVYVHYLIYKVYAVSIDNMYFAVTLHIAVAVLIGIVLGILNSRLYNWLVSDNRIIPKQFRNY